MQKINYTEFVKFFQSKIVPEVQPYEKYRIKLCKKLTFIPVAILFKIAIIFITPLIFLFGVRIFGNTGTYAEVYQIIWMFVCFFTASFFFVSLFDSFEKKKHLEHTYNTTTKYAFYEKIFNLLGLNYSKDLSARTHIAKNIGEIGKKTGIYVGNIIVDDVVSGDYNNLPFTVSDVEISYVYKSKHILFYGLFLAIKTDKLYKGETIIQGKKTIFANHIIINKSGINSKKFVKLEDVEFEKYFEVYGSDQVESRYILTPAFMRRFLDYRKQKDCPIDVVFSNEIGLDKNLFFFVHTGKDHFELPMDVSLLNQNLIYGLIKEITDILDIVDALKLDQNIGL